MRPGLAVLIVGLALPGEPPHPPVTPERIAPPNSWAGLAPVERESAWLALSTEPLQSRILAASARFLGTPYVVSPLGEGQGKDPDPMLRYDAVDCLTFVEETLALALAPTHSDVERVLTRLRYGSQPTYDDRNHLMEAEWLPHNVAKGYLRDVTRRYGGPSAFSTVKVLTRAAWRSPSSRALELPEERQVTGQYPLEVVPLDRVLEAARAAPSGTILLVVRDDLPWKVTRISHLGFLIHERDRLIVRHATKGWVNVVVDEELGHFLSRIQRHNETALWKVVGASLFEVLEPRVRELPLAERSRVEPELPEPPPVHPLRRERHPAGRETARAQGGGALLPGEPDDPPPELDARGREVTLPSTP